MTGMDEMLAAAKALKERMADNEVAEGQDAGALGAKLDELQASVNSLKDLVEAQQKTTDTLKETVGLLLTVTQGLADGEVSPSSPVLPNPVPSVGHDSRGQADPNVGMMPAIASQAVHAGVRANSGSYRDALLSVRDCMTNVEPFYGNANKKADLIDANELIAFHSWFDNAKWKLARANLPEAQIMAIISQKLQGPMLSAYIKKSKVSSAPNSVAELKTQLRSLFADSAELFTEKAMEMRFSAKRLVDDIATFGVYIQNSSFAQTADANEYIYGKLRAKLIEVKPDLLIIANAEKNLRLDSEASFEEYIQQAMTIAHSVQSKPKPSPKHELGQPKPGQGTSKKIRLLTPASADSESAGAYKRQGQDLSDADLLTRYNRCPKCAWKLKDGKHVKNESCSPAQKSKRITGMRKSLAAGRNPNVPGKISPDGQSA